MDVPMRRARWRERLISAFGSFGLVAAGSGCATGVGSLRYHNAPIVWRVDDRRDMPEPRTRPDARTRYHFDYWFYRPAARLLDVPEPVRARNVNALDEVPDSTWFTNRIGRHALTPGQIRRGPGEHDGPDPSAAWRIVSGTTGGSTPGFVIEDARGDTYLLKFDKPGHHELETGAEVVTQRLLWAVGYNVPEEHIVFLPEGRLVVAPGAEIEDEVDGHEVPLRQQDVDALIASMPADARGRRRALASRWLDGSPVGPYAPEGTRADDPNDRVRHEDRRDLRGQYVFFGWLAHTDLHSGNRLDMWVSDPAEPARHYLVHYLLDFNQALGVFGTDPKNAWDSYAHTFDYRSAGISLVTFGVRERRWESVDIPKIPAVGRFDVEHFDPESFHSRDYYIPFVRRDRYDDFWAAKIMVRLSAAHVRAAVEAAKYSDPVTTHYLTATLLGRQRKSARAFLSALTPLDAFEVAPHRDGFRLCGTDLLLGHRLVPARSQARYRARIYDGSGQPLASWERASPDTEARVCVTGPSAPSGYTIVGLQWQPKGEARPPVWVHLAPDPDDGSLRVIGVRR